MHKLRHLLAGANCLDLERPHRPLTDALDERARHFEAHVRLQQVAADLAQRLGHIGLGEHAAPREALQNRGELLREGCKHRGTKLLTTLAD